LDAVSRYPEANPEEEQMRKLAAIASIALLFAVACSTGEGEDDTTVPTPPASSQASAEPSAAASGDIDYNDHGTKTFTEDAEGEVELDNDGSDFYFSPTFIKLPGGSTAKLTLKNEGNVEHTFTAPDLDVDEELEPGASKDVEIEIGTDTRYEFWCTYHKDSGMRGAFMPH
jgi:uncharacterized cupredoxin-like copper-binding protein